MSHGKQFTLYNHAAGSNRWYVLAHPFLLRYTADDTRRKVVFVLEELGLTYETIYLDFKSGDLRGPAFAKLNPDGRIPALIDHKNNDFAIWYDNFTLLFSFIVPSYNAVVRESDAILLYIVDKYDTEKKLAVTDTNEKYQLIQWLFFQASGQG